MTAAPLNPEVIRRGIDAAIAQAEKSWSEGGIPIGSSLLDPSGNVLPLATTCACNRVTPPLMPKSVASATLAGAATGVT